MAEVQENYLNITEPYMYDNSVQKIEYTTADPPTGTNLNSPGPINLTIQPNDNYLLPSRSYLYVEGRWLKSDGSRFAPDALGVYPDITLTNNFFPYLFSTLTYRLGSQAIENFTDPGQCTTIKNLVTKTKSFNGLDMGWELDTYDGLPSYTDWMYYPMRTFTLSDFTTADPANPTKAEFKVFTQEFIPIYKAINPDDDIVNISDDEYNAIVTGANPTIENILAICNLIIDKINVIDAPQIAYLVIGDIVDRTKAGIVNAFNIVARNINLVTTSRDVTGLRQNIGFVKRKNLLFNPLIRVTPPDYAGNFSFRIPLHYLFNFCEGYQKVIYNCRHELVLNRTDDNSAIYRNLATDDGKVVLDMIRWYMPSVIPSPANEVVLRETLRNRTTVDMAFMNKTINTFNELNSKNFFTANLQFPGGVQKPRYIIAAFQSFTKTSPPDPSQQTINHSIFNGTNLGYVNTNMIDVSMVNLKINGTLIQTTESGNNFNQNRVGRWYNEFKKFKESYLNDFREDDLISYEAFRDLYRLYVFDISKQSEAITNGTANVALEFNFNNTLPSAADCDIKLFVVSFFDSLYKLQSNGSNQYIA